MASARLGLLALLVSSRYGSGRVAEALVNDQASFCSQQLVAVHLTGGLEANGEFSVFPDLRTTVHGANGISCARVNDAGAAAGVSLVDNDRHAQGASKRFVRSLALRSETVNGGSRPSADGSSSSSALVHPERGAAAGSAGQEYDPARLPHACNAVVDVLRSLDAVSHAVNGGPRLHVGIGIGSALGHSHDDHSAAAGSAGQHDGRLRL